MIVLHGAGEAASGVSIHTPVGDVESGEIAEDGDEGLALRPVAGEFGVQPREAVGYVVGLRGSPDGVEGVADDALAGQVGAPELGGGLQAGLVGLAGVQQATVVGNAESRARIPGRRRRGNRRGFRLPVP